MSKVVLAALTALVVAAAWPVSAQSIKTDGNIESDGQLVSNVATGTAPLAVSSTSMVPSLNADQVDGLEGSDLALDADLTSAEAMLVALQAQVDELTIKLIGPALVPATGQTTSSVTGEDGDLARGIVWPNPRFTDNGDGTVTDNLTGLIWSKQADCFSLRSWTEALADANGLEDSGTPETSDDCGLSDGSSAGDWRLPNVREIHSLMHYGLGEPAIPNTTGTGKWVEGDPFTSVAMEWYWSSTSLISNTDRAYLVRTDNGQISNDEKFMDYPVWPVRGGQ